MSALSARSLLVIAAALLGFCESTALADPATPALPPYSAERAYEYLEMLAGQIGERAAGTEPESRAVDYIASQFKSWDSRSRCNRCASRYGTSGAPDCGRKAM